MSFHWPAPRLETARGIGAVSRKELIASFTYALDITEGQPPGHGLRSCWIGSRIGRALGLGAAELADLYYTLLLKDLGCSSNAARIYELYAVDDRRFKHGFKTVAAGLPATLRFVLQETARGAGLVKRTRHVANILRNGDDIAQELIVARCTRGAEIAAQLDFSPVVCAGIHSLDEHWDGSGRPDRLAGPDIPLFARIALLAQVVDVFHSHGGQGAALAEAERRSGTWFDPGLVATLRGIAGDPLLWSTLAAPDLEAHVLCLLPDDPFGVDDAYLDAIAAAFGRVVDAKSPYTAGHSARVADFAHRIAGRLGLDPGRARWIRRAAFLHDIGKLGVSNAILDKPAGLTGEEWEEMRGHAAHTRAILGRIGVFGDLAGAAAAHHERLDGTGYPQRLPGAAIALETRIITACDFFDALTADRPYRAAMPVDAALAIMGREVGTALDPVVFATLADLVA